MDSKQILEAMDAAGLPRPVVWAEENSTEAIRFDMSLPFQVALGRAWIDNKFAVWPNRLTTPTHGNNVRISYRQCKMRNSLQVIYYYDNTVTVDLDQWNPDWGLAPLVMHLAVDVAYGGLRRWLKRF